MKTCNRTNNRLGDLQIDLESVFDQFFGHAKAAPKTDWAPLTDINESDSQYSIVMELPGVTADDVTVEMQEGRLEISGQKIPGDPADNEKRLKRERRSGSFSRSFEFATLVDADKIGAEFKNGLLMISVPKSEKALPRKIEVKVG